MLEPTPGGPNTLMGGSRKGLVDRLKDILLTPKTEWAVIDSEPATIGGIYTSYVLILAAIGPICMVIGQQVFGFSGFGINFKPPIAYSIGQAVITYVMSLVSVYVSALIIDALAPSFGGTKNQVKAFQVAAYSATAAWLAGVFQIVPMLAILAIVGLYSLYLLYLGLPRLMRVSDDKAVGYTVVVIVVQIVLYFVIGLLVGILVGAFLGSMLLSGAAAVPTVHY
jgi:hypothetical protein